MFRKNQLVETWFDTGTGRHMGGPQLLYGRVMKAGPQTAYILWESGLCNRIRHDDPKGVIPARDEDQADNAMRKTERRG